MFFGLGFMLKEEILLKYENIFYEALCYFQMKYFQFVQEFF